MVSDEPELRFVYVGPVPDGRKAITSASSTLSPDNLRLVVARAWVIGRYQMSGQFKKDGLARGFDVLDTETVIRFGKLVGMPQHDTDHSHWICHLIGLVEGRNLELAVALDDFEDYDTSPLLTLITGHWR